MPSTYRKFYLSIRTLHIYFSMLALLLLFFFSLTGFMMNHSEWFKMDEISTQTSHPTLPPQVLHGGPGGAADQRTLVDYLRSQYGVRGEIDASGLGDDPIHLVFKSAHHRFDVDVAPADGKSTITQTTTSFGGFLGNLHKGSDTGAPWRRVIDVVSILLALIAVTGLVLWISLSSRRVLGLICLALCLFACATLLIVFVA